MPDNEVESTVTFSVQINPCNTNETETRSLAPGYRFGDGTSVNTVKCYVYNRASGNNSEPMKVVDVPVTNLKGTFSILLPRLQAYDLVFLATSIPQTDVSSKLYYSTTERTLKVNYSSTNDEEMDCFFASVQNVTTDSEAIPIVLKRPFAQINFGAMDYYSYNTVTPISNVSVSVSGIYNKMNLMDGSIIGNPINVNFSPEAPPTGQTFPVSNVTYLAMNYVLVNQRKLIDVSCTINHQNVSLSSKSFSKKNVGAERNHQTNLTITGMNE